MARGNQREEEMRNAKRRFRLDTGEPADWGSVEPALIAAAISAVSATGGAIRFGYTRDGGAYAVGILGDGEPYTVYISPREDVHGVLQQLVEQFRFST